MADTLSNRRHTIQTLPAELLQHIAFFVATPELKGPPSDLARLCRTSKSIHASLCLSDNPALYASIFRFKFDTAAPIRRLGTEYITASALGAEMCNRFQSMKRIRAGVGSRRTPCDWENREHDIWTAIFLMLENDGKNSVQLKQFAFVEQWLLDFFLDHSGGSYASEDIFAKAWPRDNRDNQLSVWLLWLCDADWFSLNYSSTVHLLYCEILRAYAMAANKYPLTQYSWTEFTHRCPSPDTPMVYTHYNLHFTPTAPAISISAILGYISRVKEPEVLTFSATHSLQTLRIESDSTQLVGPVIEGPSTDSPISLDWDSDWERCTGSEPTYSEGNTTDYVRFYRPGTLEGTWEGIFTYTEFSAYASVLSGGPPQSLHDGAVGQNLQIWKLREYNLDSGSSDSFSSPLPPGEPFDAFFPQTIIEERGDRVVFTRASDQTVYFRCPRDLNHAGDTVHRGRPRDVVVLGEGHSSWGDFELKGRIRASDGFVTILKKYVSGHTVLERFLSKPQGTNTPQYEVENRTNWLYRGYLVGGKLAGRWRETLTPLVVDGYEGAFELSRRV